MTTFDADRAIYLQIADRICDEIVIGTLAEESRVPSVREYSAMLQVNINTTMKAFEELARAGIVQNKRGLGYFVSTGAKERIKEERRKQFREKTLAMLFKQMSMLGISMDEVVQEYEKQISAEQKQ